MLYTSKSPHLGGIKRVHSKDSTKQQFGSLPPAQPWPDTASVWLPSAQRLPATQRRLEKRDWFRSENLPLETWFFQVELKKLHGRRLFSSHSLHGYMLEFTKTASQRQEPRRTTQNSIWRNMEEHGGTMLSLRAVLGGKHGARDSEGSHRHRMDRCWNCLESVAHWSCSVSKDERETEREMQRETDGSWKLWRCRVRGRAGKLAIGWGWWGGMSYLDSLTCHMNNSNRQMATVKGQRTELSLDSKLR